VESGAAMYDKEHFLELYVHHMLSQPDPTPSGPKLIKKIKIGTIID